MLVFQHNYKRTNILRNSRRHAAAAVECTENIVDFQTESTPDWRETASVPAVVSALLIAQTIKGVLLTDPAGWQHSMG